MFHSRTQHTDNHVSTFDFTHTYLPTDSCPKAYHYKSSNLSDDGVIQFRPNKKNGDESGVCSPPLWSKSLPRNPQEPHKKMKNSPPSLRVQAIVRGQVELMEMVKTMPEPLYELSLKDIVDHQKVGNQEYQVPDQENVSSYVKKKASSPSNLKKQGSIRKQGSLKKVEKKMVRTGSNINGENNNSNNKGLFLKMVFPMPFGGNKKKVAKPKTKENPYAEASAKVAVGSGKSDGKIVSDQKEWWRRRHSATSDDSESGGLSSSSGSSGSNDSSGSSQSNQSCRKKSGLLRGCSPFYSIKNKTEE